MFACADGVMVNRLELLIGVSSSNLGSLYYAQIPLGKVMNPSPAPGMG